MRKYIALFAIAVTGIATFAGCTKKSSGSQPHMTASIGVFPYSAPYAIAYRDKGQMIIEGLGGTTTTPTLPYIVLHLNNYVGLTGVYPIDSTGENGAEYVTGQTEFLFSRIGTIVITSASQDRIKGSFTFLCSDSTMVNSGDFDAAIKN